MSDLIEDVAAAKKAIETMLAETPRPTQKRISIATGLTQSYIAKINRREFTRLNASIRRVVEYSKLQPHERIAAETKATGIATRIGANAAKLAARDAALGEAVAEFVERLARLP